MSKAVGFRVSDEVYAELEKLASRYGASVGLFMRHLAQAVTVKFESVDDLNKEAVSALAKLKVMNSSAAQELKRLERLQSIFSDVEIHFERMVGSPLDFDSVFDEKGNVKKKPTAKKQGRKTKD